MYRLIQPQAHLKSQKIILILDNVLIRSLSLCNLEFMRMQFQFSNDYYLINQFKIRIPTLSDIVKLPNLFINNYQQTLTKIILVKHCLYEPLLSKSLFIHVLFKYCNSSGKVYEVFHFLFSRNKLIQAWTQCKFQYFFVFLEVRVSVKHCSCILSTRVYQFF